MSSDDEQPDTIELRQWYRTAGGGLLNCEFLESDHEESWYSQIKAMGLRPEDYGVYHQDEIEKRELYDTMTKGELVDEIMRLKKAIEAFEKYF